MLVEEDVTIARWGLAATMVVGFLLTAAFLCWLHERDIHPFEPILKFMRRPVGEILLVLLCVGGLVQYGATKGFLGNPRMTAPRQLLTPLASAPESGDAVVGIFPAWTNAVTNVCATGIMPAETSVFLRAHWPWNLYPAPTGIEVYAAPLLSTNGWVGVGTAPVIDGDNSAVIELPYSVLPDGWTSSMFFMLGLNVDTDQDGLSDAFENIVSKTDPNLADTDGDGMPDGWEYGNGLNPLSDPTDDEAGADADGDGIANLAEMDYGTDPQKRDSDGDGIDDLDELGLVRQLDGFVWYDTSDGVNILASETDSSIDDKVWTVDLHYPAVLGGKAYDRLTIDSNALVYLIPSNGMDVTQSKYSYGSLPAGSLAQTNIAVAVNWRNMNLNRQNGSQVRVANVASNNCTVVEFVNLERRGHPSDTMTAQVVVPGGTNGTILVNYFSLTENLDGRSATVGLMDSTARDYADTNKLYALQWSYGQSGSIASEMTLAYRVGTGTDPTEKDTDGDGLDDNEEIRITGTDPCLVDTDGDGLSDRDEVERRTNPLLADTDGDGMPDGWEAANGFDPRSVDSESDADSDGLSNLLEWRCGTDPRNPDMDGDGLVDSREVAWVDEEIGDMPWLDVTPLKVIGATGEPSLALYDCELPFTNWIAGGLITVAVADLNGVVYFGNGATTNGLVSSTSGYDLKRDSGKDCAMVAGYWSNLKLRSSLSSAITFGTARHDEKTHFVIQYENVGTYSGSATNTISFQVSFCESTPDVVTVRYGNVIDTRNNYSLSIGAQGGADDNRDNYPKLSRFYGSTSYPAMSGKTLVYHFGCGGEPREADTDGDGLDDAGEVSAGTNPRKADTDGDGLDDGWELEYGLDPLSAEGRDGAEGDFDNDGIENVREHDSQTNPASADTDGDGLSDGEEMGFITVGNPIPWLNLDESEDLTLPLLDEYRSNYSLDWTLPAPLRVQGESVTNLTLTSHGWLFLNRAGYANPGHSTGSRDIDSYVDRNTLAMAVCGDGSLLVSTNLTDRSTSVRVGTATHDGIGYAVVECVNMYRGQPNSRTNSVSWQVAVPTNVTEHVYVRYRDVTGEYVDGRYATIGMQSFGAKWTYAYCERDRDSLYDGLALDFHLGRNSNPNDGDTDGDGLSDSQEVALGTNLNSSDTDGDGMPDGWEQRHFGNGFDPNVDNSTDANPNNDRDADPDGDGLTNGREAEVGTNPGASDTDGDGIADGDEIGQGTDPTDRADTLPVQWVTVDGDLDEDVPKTETATLSIPTGRTCLVCVFVASEEYPIYTGQSSEWNDALYWNIRADGFQTLTQDVRVNNEDGAWDDAQELFQGAYGYCPVVLKDLAFYTAGATNLSVSVTIRAMNVRDGRLPSSVIVGMFPLNVVQANMPTSTGVAGTTDAGTAYVRENIPSNGVAYITGQPAAPQLTAQFKGLPEWMDVRWGMTLLTERSNRRFDGIDDRTLSQVERRGDELYDITTELQGEIVGGACTLNVCIGDSATLVYSFFIRGKNPLDAAARTYITENVDEELRPFAWKIAKHETIDGRRVYNQFNASQNRFKELPNWGSPHGWGISQVDRGENGDTTAEVYDWHSNIMAMNAVLREKRTDAIRFLGYYSSAYSNLPNWSDPPSTNINGQIVSAEMWSTITLYNGAEGIPVQQTPTHQRGFCSPLRFDPQSGKWIFYQNTRNPNYVRDVMNNSIELEVE